MNDPLRNIKVGEAADAIAWRDARIAELEAAIAHARQQAEPVKVSQKALMQQAAKCWTLARCIANDEPYKLSEVESELRWAANYLQTIVAPPVDDETAIVVTWDEAQARIVAVTQQDCDGRIVKVIAEAPADDEAVRLLETSKTVLTIALMLAKEAAKHLPASAPIDMEEAKVKLGLVMLHIDAIDAYLAKVGK